MLDRAAYMRLALEAAARARGRTSPNPMVGCVIVGNVGRRRRIVGVGYHRRAGLAHAEVEALRRAGSAARGADVYVTLEPCDHFGRTGPCTEALISAGVRRVIVAMRDPNPIVDGRGVRRLRRAGIAVEVGLLGAEAEALNVGFCQWMRHRRPFVTAKLAMSLDGRVATRTGASRWITGEAARRHGHVLRDQLDGIAVGLGTVLADDPKLTCRLPRGRDPVRIVFDSQARTPLGAQVLRVGRRSEAPTWILVGPRAPARRILALERAGAEVLRCPGRNGRIDPVAALRLLGGRGVLTLLVEGGPTLLGALFDADRIDRIVGFVAPSIIGGVLAQPAVLGLGAAKPAGVRIRSLVLRRLGEDLLVEGDVDR